MEKISTPLRTKQILAENNFSIKKKFGQNFLINQNVLYDIIDGAEVEETDNVIEIGPGIGNLTQFIAEAAKKVVAIEIDQKIIPILKKTVDEYENVEVINKDILKVDIKELIEEYFGDEPVKIVANLPYYITTPIIMTLLESGANITSITIMIQKEVADRLNAKPSTKEYGSLTLAIKYYCETSIVTTVSPASFIPQPKVASTVINLKVTNNYNFYNEKELFKIIRGCFATRRKTLVNSLSNRTAYTKEEIKEALIKCEIKENIRGEALSLEEYIQFCTELLKK